MQEQTREQILSRLPEPAKAPERRADAQLRIASRVIFGAAVIAALTIGIGAWATTAQLTGAVMAPGKVVVDRNVKKVQHRDGGIVATINIKNGDTVDAGDVLIELDDTQIRAELGVVRGQLLELTARKARLAAEVSDAGQMRLPEGFEQQSEQARLIARGERRLFQVGRDNLAGQIRQLELQVGQMEEEIAGIKAQKSAKEGQLSIIRMELEQLSKLFEKKLTSITRLYSLQREAKRLSGELGGLVAQIARTKGKISEVRVQILSIAQAAKLEAQRDLRNTEAKIAELVERELAAADKLKRTKLFAPQTGIVHELAVHTIGGVVTSAETVMVIVPDNERLIVEGRFAPVDIDQIIVGREARLRFSAFNQRTTPQVGGRVIQVSADVSTDPKTSQQFYLGRIELHADARTALKDLKLLPGMPVEIFVSTGTRTAFSYIAKPITDQFSRAFRED